MGKAKPKSKKSVPKKKESVQKKVKTVKKKVKSVKVRGLRIPLPSKPIDKRQANDRVGRAIEEEEQPQFYQITPAIVKGYIKALKDKGLFQKGGRRHYDYDITFDGNEQDLIDNLIQKACDAGTICADGFTSTQGLYTPMVCNIIVPRSKDDPTLVRVKAYVLLAVPSLYTRGSKKDEDKAQVAKQKLDNLPEA